MDPCFFQKAGIRPSASSAHDRTICFAPTIAVHAMVASTPKRSCLQRRPLRIWLAGERAGASDVIAELPGFPANLGAGDDGIVWVAYASEPTPAFEACSARPSVSVRSLRRKRRPLSGVIK